MTLEIPYIDRLLKSENEKDNKFYRIDSLIERNDKVIVILAEPGAGKTRLLQEISYRYSTRPLKAHILLHQLNEDVGNFLLIDGCDEVGKLTQDTTPLIIKARAYKASKVIFASRASEWSKADTQMVNEIFQSNPVIIRLEPFSFDEQKAFYNNYFHKQDNLKPNFDVFYKQVDDFNLSNMLSNPQWLKILIDAYDEGNYQFKSKKDIFEKSILKASRERDECRRDIKQRPEHKKIIECSEEIFTALMLSSCVGVSNIEEYNENSAYPLVKSLFDENNNYNDVLRYIFDTNLFKQTNDINQFETTHRVITEYCVGKFLADKIIDINSELTFKRVLSIIAPSNVVREDLRGVIGWLATFGTKEMQSELIKIDAYSVLVNGDSSELSDEIKLELLHSLEELSKEYPHFRREDAWRTLYIPNFFNDSLLRAVEKILQNPTANSSLKDLILELLSSSKLDCSLIEGTLINNILHSDKANFYHRKICIDIVIWNDRIKVNKAIKTLLTQKTYNSLNLLTYLFNKIEVNSVDLNTLLDFCKEITIFYPQNRHFSRHIESTYRLENFLKTLSQEQIIYLLDELSKNLKCSCNDQYGCQCNISESKVIGCLLDCLFEQNTSYNNAPKLWFWLKNLNFYGGNRSAKDSKSVDILFNNQSLKLDIYKLAIQEQLTPEDIRILMFSRVEHSGLRLTVDDCIILIEYAYETEHQNLWDALYQGYSYYNNDKKIDTIRHLLRKYSKQNQKLAQIWYRNNYKTKQYIKSRLENDSNKRHRKLKRKDKKRKAKNYQINKDAFKNNKELILSGKRSWWLRMFTKKFQYNNYSTPDISFVPEDMQEKALLNCFDFLEPHIPNFNEIYVYNEFTSVLYVATILHFRLYNNLSNISFKILRLLKLASVGFHSDKIPSEEIKALQNEIDRIIFKTSDDKREFLQEYFENKLNQEDENAHISELYLLGKTTFEDVSPEIALEWLENYNELSYESLRFLFKLALKFSNQLRLKAITQKRYIEYSKSLELQEERPQSYEFWCIRAFLYLDFNKTNVVEKWLVKASESAPKLAHIFDYYQNSGWINLTAEKIFCILGNFVDIWKAGPLPNSYPTTEKVYGFLHGILWKISNDNPQNVIIYAEKILSDECFISFHNNTKTLYYEAMKKNTLLNYQAPKATDIKNLYKTRQFITVEHLRAFLMEELEEYQKWLKGNPTDPLEVFFTENDKHHNEETISKRVVEHLSNRLKSLNLITNIEARMAYENRCDIVINTIINGKEIALMVEAKGQWNPELFTAAQEQLYDKYAIHPSAEKQGIYLVYWFGKDEKVAGSKCQYNNLQELRQAIIENMNPSLHGKIDVFILDLEYKVKSNSKRNKKQKSP